MGSALIWIGYFCPKAYFRSCVIGLRLAMPGQLFLPNLRSSVFGGLSDAANPRFDLMILRRLQNHRDYQSSFGMVAAQERIGIRRPNCGGVWPPKAYANVIVGIILTAWDNTFHRRLGVQPLRGRVNKFRGCPFCFCFPLVSNSECKSRCFTKRTFSRTLSIPTELRPRLRATTFVVPDPVKGSRTQSPGCVNNLMNHSGRAFGNVAEWFLFAHSVAK